MAPDGVDLQPCLGMVDPMLEQLALNVIAALKHPEESFNGLHIDQVAIMAAAHLLRRYAKKPATRTIATLAGRAEPGLWCAREAGMSQVMFAKRFTALYEESPYKFVVRQRVERARQSLAGSDLPISEIALQTGFCSQRHLSDGFKRMVGETPNLFRRASFV